MLLVPSSITKARAAARLLRCSSTLAPAPNIDVRHLRLTTANTSFDPTSTDKNGLASASVRCFTSSNSSSSHSQHSHNHSRHNRRRTTAGHGEERGRSSGRHSAEAQWHDAHKTLGIQVGSPLDEARRAFVRLALRLHPDKLSPSSTSPTSASSPPQPTDLNRTEGHDEFVKVRSAFETIRTEHEDFARRGTGEARASASSESPASFSRDVLRYWYFRETEDDLNFGFAMTDATRQEVANVHATMAPGGLDRGGMWDMARQLAAENEGKDSVPQPPATHLLSAESSPSPADDRTTASSCTNSASRRRRRG